MVLPPELRRCLCTSNDTCAVLHCAELRLNQCLEMSGKEIKVFKKILMAQLCFSPVVFSGVQAGASVMIELSKE